MPIANYASSIKTFLQPNYLYGSVRYPFKGAYNLFDVYLNEALLATDGINTATTFGSLSGGDKWIGGVLAPNGYIYGIPFDSTSVLKIQTNIYSRIDQKLLSAYSNKC